MEALNQICLSIQESVEKIKRTIAPSDRESINKLVQAEIVLKNIIENATPTNNNMDVEKEAGNSNTKKRKRADNATQAEDEPETKKAKLDLPIIPCRHRGAYGIFFQEKLEELKISHPDLGLPDLRDMRKKMWDNLSTEEKQVYYQKAKQDLARYEKEVAEYVEKGGKMRPSSTNNAFADDDSDSDEDNNIMKSRIKIGNKNIRSILRQPKRPQSAWIIFSLDAKSKPEFRNLPFSERVKAIAQRWKIMSDEEKVVYNQRSALDYERYERETKEYYQRMREQNGDSSSSDEDENNGQQFDSDEEESGSGSESEESESSSSEEVMTKPLKKTQKRRDPNKPKAASSPYVEFCKEVRPSLPAEMTFSEKVRHLSAQWQKMTAEQRQPYEQRAALDKERYRREMREYNEKQQNSTDATGTKKTPVRSGKNQRKEQREQNTMPPAPAEDEQQEEKPRRKSFSEKNNGKKREIIIIQH